MPLLTGVVIVGRAARCDRSSERGDPADGPLRSRHCTYAQRCSMRGAACGGGVPFVLTRTPLQRHTTATTTGTEGGRMALGDPAKIRNVAVVGHRGAGKTSLVEALLYTSGAKNRLGNVPDGTTTMDHDEDEIKRQMSIWRDPRPRRIGTSAGSTCWTRPGEASFINETMGVPAGRRGRPDGRQRGQQGRGADRTDLEARRRTRAWPAWPWST